MRKILYVKQTDKRDCGVCCLSAIVRFYGGYVTREYLRDLTKTTFEGVSVYSLIGAGDKLGFEALAVKATLADLKDKLPVIAHVIIDLKYGHFVVITKIDTKTITIMDPDGGFKKISYDKWNRMSTNTYLLYKPKTAILKQAKEEKFLEFLNRVVKKYKYTCLLVLFLSFLYTISSIFLSYQFSFFLDLLKEKNGKTMQFLFLFLVLVIFLKEMSNLFRGYLINYLNHKLDKSLLDEVYNHIIRLPYLYFKNRSKGDILTRVQDVFTIREVISKFFVTIAIDLVFLFLVLVVIFKINLKLGMLSFMVTFLYILVLVFYHSFLTKKMKSMKEKEVLVNNHLIESLSSINTIKGMQIEEFLRENLRIKYRDYQETSFRLIRKSYQENFLKQLIYGIGLLIIIYVGFQEVMNQELSLSELLVLNSLLIYYFEPLQNMCNLQFLIKEANVSFTRIKELLSVSCENLKIDEKLLNRHLKGNIKIANLHYSYNGRDDVLKCEKLEIKSCDRVLFYGISGGGKSTLMKLICRYIEDFEGEILIDNQKLYSYHLLDIRRKIAYLSQDEVLYTDTIYNNIVLKKEISYSTYLEIIKLTGVDKILERSYLKENMVLENNAADLSGGEKQRILLARALAKNSDIYIFDESFSALDMKSERMLLKNIFSYLKNKTIIVISHRFNNRDLYQKFVLIENGVVYEY